MMFMLIEAEESEIDRTRKGPVALLGSIALTAAIGFFYVFATPTTAGVVGLILCTLCCYRVFSLVDEHRGGPVSISFYTFILAWIGIPSLVQMSAGRFPWPDVVDSTLFLRAEMLAVLAVLSHWFGWSRAGRHSLVKIARDIHRSDLALKWLVLITIAISVPALLYTGGLSARFSSRTEFVNQLQSVGVGGESGANSLVGILQILPSASTVVLSCAGVLSIARSLRAGLRISLAQWVYIAISIMALVLFDNPLSATRYVSLSALLSLSLCVFWIKSRRTRLGFAVVLAIGLLVAYPLAAAFKGQQDSAPRSITTDTYASIDFDGFQETINTLYYTDRYGHSGGIYTASAVLFWLPRSIWPEKASPASFDITEARNYKFKNLSLPIWMELFLDFSFPGLLVGMSLLGYVSMKLDEQYKAGSEDGYTLLAIVVCGAEIGFIRGPMGAQAPFVGALLLLSGFYILASRGSGASIVSQSTKSGEGIGRSL